MTKSRNERYLDRRHRPLIFLVGGWGFLHVLLMNGVISFGRLINLNPRYIRSFNILWIVLKVAFEFSLPPTFSPIHSVFHISKLRSYIPYKSNVLQCDAFEFDDHLIFVEEQEIWGDCGREPFLLLRPETLSIQGGYLGDRARDAKVVSLIFWAFRYFLKKFNFSCGCCSDPPNHLCDS